MVFYYTSSDIYLGLTWRKPFSNQKVKLYTAQMITCIKIHRVLSPRTEKTLLLRKAKEAQVTVNREKG